MPEASETPRVRERSWRAMQDRVAVGVLVGRRRRVYETAAAARLRILLLARGTSVVGDPMIGVEAKREQFHDVVLHGMARPRLGWPLPRRRLRV